VAKYTIKKIDEMEAIFRGAFKRARAELGVESFGMNVIDMPPNVGDQYPEHSHDDDGQEEVYMVLRGAAEIEIDGERHRLEPDTMVRVGPGVPRKLRTGSEGARILALGGCAGKAYEPPEFSKLGAPDPLVQQSA
jgi:mannose-6-phosphate isomerase-like protein (cupin superfamily)